MRTVTTSLTISTFFTSILLPMCYNLFVGGIYESTKRWENVFYFISACNLLGALLMFITIFINHYVKSRNSAPSEVIIEE